MGIFAQQGRKAGGLTQEFSAGAHHMIEMMSTNIGTKGQLFLCVRDERKPWLDDIEKDFVATCSNL